MNTAAENSSVLNKWKRDNKMNILFIPFSFNRSNFEALDITIQKKDWLTLYDEKQ
ncbi:hypothetical protein TWF173_000613 [Orbilia oligospora]|nr:hypothetical protein TWF173_000613 [Orbilia oligospora]